MKSIPSKIPLAIILTVAVAAGGCGGQAKEGPPSTGNDAATKPSRVASSPEKPENRPAKAGASVEEIAAEAKAGANSAEKKAESVAGEAEAKASSAEDRAASLAREAEAKADRAVREAIRETRNAVATGGAGRVVLEIKGVPGTSFSGVCVVGGQRTDFAAKTPQRYTFEADGGGAQCRVSNETADSSTLRATLFTGGERHVRQTGPGRSDLTFSYSGSGFSSQVVSSTGSGGVRSVNSVRMESRQGSSVVTRHIEGERDVAP